MMGVMSVLVSEVLADCARRWARVPLLLPQGATRAELREDCNQGRQQRDLEGPGCQ